MALKLRWLLAVVALAIAAAGGWLPSYYAGVMTEGLIFAIFALSLNLLVGYTGLPSLGHAAYFAAGAYAAGLTSIHFSTNFFAEAGAGIAAGMILSGVFGLLALRAVGVYFLMITLALAQIAWGIAFSWRDVTGGDDGLRGIVRPTFAPLNVDLTSAGSFYLFALAVLVLVLAVLAVLLQSPFGRSLNGIQERQARMSALGYNVWAHKYIAFVLSGGLAGFAGMLFVQYKGFVSPEAASITMSAEVMLMVIIGGAGTLSGPVLGAFVVLLLSNTISGFTARWTFILGALYVVVMLVAPNGIIGESRALIGRWRRARAAS